MCGALVLLHVVSLSTWHLILWDPSPHVDSLSNRITWTSLHSRWIHPEQKQMLYSLLESELRSPQMPLPSHFIGQNKSEGQHRFKKWGNRHKLLLEKAVKMYCKEVWTQRDPIQSLGPFSITYYRLTRNISLKKLRYIHTMKNRVGKIAVTNRPPNI